MRLAAGALEAGGSTIGLTAPAAGPLGRTAGTVGVAAGRAMVVGTIGAMVDAAEAGGTGAVVATAAGRSSDAAGTLGGRAGSNTEERRHETNATATSTANTRTAPAGTSQRRLEPVVATVAVASPVRVGRAAGAAPGIDARSGTGDSSSNEASGSCAPVACLAAFPARTSSRSSAMSAAVA